MINKRQVVAGALSISMLAVALPGMALAQDEAVPYPVEGVQWQLSSYLDGETMTDVLEGVETTLFLNGGEVVGNAGCNSYFGSYEIDAESLTFPEPFGSTLMFCDGPGQVVEDAYLSLLQTTEGWSIDEEGMLSLTGADGAVSLVYGEPPVAITATDIEALTAELESLQAQIDEAMSDVEALAGAAASVNVNKMNNRISANATDIAALQDKTKGLNVEKMNRLSTRNESAIAANTQAISDLNSKVNKLRDRVKVLEENDKAQDERLTALEEVVFVPTPQ